MNDLLDYGPDGLTLVTARERIRELEADLAKRDECHYPTCLNDKLALLNRSLEAALREISSDNFLPAPDFCPKCLMTGGHQPSCSKAETEVWPCPNCGALLKHARDCPTSDRGTKHGQT